MLRALELLREPIPAAKKAAPAAPPKPDRPEGEVLACAAARFAHEMKAEDVIVLDVSAVSTITDYFVICTGSSLPHLKAIAREVREQMMETHKAKPGSSDGQVESQWVVLDYGIFMLHAFHHSKRELYALEDLWGDARKVDWQTA